MITDIIVTDNIYNSQTREYMSEVVTSYSIGNYRSAVVMLYSVTVCDVLLKLRELKDMYNDTTAEKLLEDVDKAKANRSNKSSKSGWEWDLLKKVQEKTRLLDDESYNNLETLYNYRCLSAHPAMNTSFELISPSKEMTIALIKNAYKDILVKPPIFMKDVIDMMTRDLMNNKEIYDNNYQDLSIYLNNKYYNRMTDAMRRKTLRAFWKFCFILSEDENCKTNRTINTQALKVLIVQFEKETIDEIKNNDQNYVVANDDSCIESLIELLSCFPNIYKTLNSDVRLHIDKFIGDNKQMELICWFKFDSIEKYLENLEKANLLQCARNRSLISKAASWCSDHGVTKELLDIFIRHFGDSHSYDSANWRYETFIKPYLSEMDAPQFEELISSINNNDQIYGRNSNSYTNSEIYSVAQRILPKDFNFAEYKHFKFSKNINI